MEERGVGFEDAGDEEGIVGVDCSAETQRGVDPVAAVSLELNCKREIGGRLHVGSIISLLAASCSRV